MITSTCLCCQATDAHWLCHAAGELSTGPAGIAPPRRLRRHHVIALEGSEATHVHVVRSGQVRLFKALDDGREFALRFVGKGGIFGLECLDGRPSSYTAEVLRNAEVCSIPAPTLRNILDQSPHLTQKLLHLIIVDLLDAQDMLINLGVRSARERVAAFLMRQYRVVNGANGSSLPIVLEISRRQLADHLGLASETLIRTLTELQREHVVRIEGRTLDVLDTDRLGRYAR
jgi:CRP/FNR family transcriptional regulator